MEYKINNRTIDYLKSADKKLAKVIDCVGTLNVSETADAFYFLVREIVGQMISAGVKRVIFDRLLNLCLGELSPDKINSLSLDNLRGIGLSMSKSNYIKNLAELTAKGEIDFDSLASMSDKEVLDRLMAIKGIGIWTSKMYLIFYLKREDVLPIEDGAFMQSFRWLYGYKNPDQRTVDRICKKWRPYTSIGARYLYAALDSGLTKIPVNEFLNSR